MVTQDEFSGSQKLLGKIADLPEGERQLVRSLIRYHVKQKHLVQKIGGTIDTAAQATEELIDIGALKIVFDQSIEALADNEHIAYHIVPTSNY
jgi:hypothetical protein